MLRLARALKHGANDKYTPSGIGIVTLLMAVVIALVGFSDINLVILAGDIAMVIAVLPLEQRTRTIMKRKDSKTLLQFESPLQWLKICMRFSSASLLSSLAYGIIASGLNIGVNNPPIESDMLFFAIAFFLCGFLYIIRVAEFLIDPSSGTNIFAGKAIKLILDVGVRLALLASIAWFQIINGIFLYYIIYIVFVQNMVLQPITILYAFLLALSFVGMVPVAWSVVIRLKEPIRRWGWVALACFVSPWILQIVATILLHVGIKLV